MSKRKALIEQLLNTKSTLEIITELKKLPIEDNELHVIPYGTKLYRITLFCDDCKEYDTRWDRCKRKTEKCPPKKIYDGIYMGNDDSNFGTKTFFSKEEAENNTTK